jgi:hypothetical protein
MKIAYLAVAALGAAWGAQPEPAQAVAAQLQKGIYAQQTAGDLDSAIRIYRQVIASKPARAYAAQAQTLLAQALAQQSGGAAAVQEPTTAQTAGSPDMQPAADGSPEDTADLTDNHVRAFKVQVRSLFNKGAYSELEALAGQLRSKKLRFKGGAWKLNTFYRTVGSPGSLTATDAAWQARIAKLEQWIKDSPASPAPRVALARAYLRFAWKARGNGWSNTVTPEGWALFRQRVQSARTVLEDAAKIGAGDPEWYHAMQTVALAQGWDRTQVDALANQALANEPGYYYFATAYANYLLPKWYGKPGESERYAEQVADQAGGDDGNATYFKIAEALNCCRMTQAPALAWPRVRQGFSALDQLYGSTNRQRNALAYLALRAGDTPTAQQIFTRIGDDWDESVWKTKALFDASRTGQTVGGTRPLRADGAAGGTATAND